MLPTMQLRISPLALIYPPLASDEMATLLASIKANGLLVPIVVRRDELLDGRHRLEACQRLSIEPKVDRRDALTDDEARDLVIALNGHRRQLTVAQRALIALSMTKAGSANLPSPLSQATAAERFGISARTLGGLAVALKKSPELGEKIRLGEIVSVHEATLSAQKSTQARAARLQSVPNPTRTTATPPRRSSARSGSKTTYPAEFAALFGDLSELAQLLDGDPLTLDQAEELLGLCRQGAQMLEDYADIRRREEARS